MASTVPTNVFGRSTYSTICFQFFLLLSLVIGFYHSKSSIQIKNPEYNTIQCNAMQCNHRRRMHFFPYFTLIIFDMASTIPTIFLTDPHIQLSVFIFLFLLFLVIGFYPSKSTYLIIFNMAFPIPTNIFDRSTYSTICFHFFFLPSLVIGFYPVANPVIKLKTQNTIRCNQHRYMHSSH
jgi:hypothetical protein